MLVCFVGWISKINPYATQDAKNDENKTGNRAHEAGLLVKEVCSNRNTGICEASARHDDARIAPILFLDA